MGMDGHVHLPGYNTETARILEDTDLMVLPRIPKACPTWR